MPSFSLRLWNSDRKNALDEIESAHRSVGGAGRGRRLATHQINQAYAVLLSSQFQGFCHDLHSECADHLVQGVTPTSLRTACRNALFQTRKPDRGNPHPSALGSDFNRFELAFWGEVRRLYVRSPTWQNRLDELNQWRNAIAHQDFTNLDATTLQLQAVRKWRKACNRLAEAFDDVMRRHIQSIIGTAPW